MAAALTVDGLHVRTGVAVALVELTESGPLVVLADGTALAADVVALCVGGEPVAPGNGLGTELLGHGRPAGASPAGGGTHVRAAGVSVVVVGPQGPALHDVPHQTLHLRPHRTVPGATPARLVVHVGVDGLLIGAEAVGAAEVEARIDVLADALRASADATGAAAGPARGGGPDPAPRLPLDAAGAAGAPASTLLPTAAEVRRLRTAGVLDGTLRLWYPDELDDVLRDALVLDVRSADEFAQGHLEGAMNVPHGDVTGRAREVGAVAGGRPVRLHCQNGRRSYAAHRVLAAAGLDSAALSGGLSALLVARPETRLVGCRRRSRPDARPA